MELGSCTGDVVIGDKTYHLNGESLSVRNGQVYLNGVLQDEKDEKGQKILYRPTKIVVTGECKKVTTTSGDIEIHGDVGSASSTSGNVTITGDVKGDASSTSGNVVASRIEGDASSVSGDVRGRSS